MMPTTPYYDRHDLIVRLCKRGEAYCGTYIGELAGKRALCLEPAAVAYRISESCRWSYACAEHYGVSKTDELRREAGDDNG